MNFFYHSKLNDNFLVKPNVIFALILTMGLALSLFLFEYINQKNIAQQQAFKRHQALSSGQYVEAGLKRRILQIKSVANLFSTSDWVSYEEFEKIIKLVYTDFPENRRLSWVIHRAQAELPRLRDQIRRNGGLHANFYFFEYDYKARKPLPINPEHDPVSAIVYDYPTYNNPYFIGRIISEERAVSRYFQNALAAENIISSGIAQPLPAMPEPHIFLVHPVYQFENEFNKKPLGFVTSSNQLSDIFSRVLQGSIEQPLRFRLIDHVGNEYHYPENIIISVNEAQALNKDHQPSEALSAENTLHYPINMLGQNWSLMIDFKPTEHLAHHILLLALVVGLLVISFLIALFVRNALLKETELSSKVDLQTQALTIKNQELNELVVQVKAAAQAKTDFLANMSHEIRTPMNGVIGISQLLNATELNSQQQDYLNKIEISAKHLMVIINDILDFSKIESGNIQLEIAPFSINSVVDHLQATFNDECKAKGIDFKVDVDSSVHPDLMGDIVRINQVLLNLCSNAVKFTERGGVYVSILASEVYSDFSVEKQFYNFKFIVKDTGIGIAQIDMVDLFDAFTQADASTSRRFGGTGLGLSISKKLCEVMGGTIEAHSVEGQGSQFIANVKLELNNQVIIQPEEAIEQFSSMPSILVIDDNPLALKIYDAVLTQMNADVTLCATAMEALALLTSNERKYSVILLDWTMPEIDGGEFITRMNAMALAVSPKVIVVSAYNSDVIKQNTSALGVSCILHKPCEHHLLYKEIQRVMCFEPVQPVGAPEFKLENMRVLVAEDNEINQIIIRELLQKAGADVYLVNDGQACLDYLAQNNVPDVILMDIQMPVLDGVETTKLIRASKQPYSKVPIIALTANVLDEDIQHYVNNGMNAHLAKPIDVNQTIKIIIEQVDIFSNSLNV